MRAIAILIVLSVAGCKQPPAQTQPDAAAPAVQSTPSAPAAPAISGTFTAISNTAMGITGDLTIDPYRLVFAKGQNIATTKLDAPDMTGIVGQTLYGENPPSDFTVELRRIESVTSNDPKAQTICGVGDQAATHIAFSHNVDDDTVSLVAFHGARPPVSADAVCATFLYAPATPSAK